MTLYDYSYEFERFKACVRFSSIQLEALRIYSREDLKFQYLGVHNLSLVGEAEIYQPQ